MAVEPTPAAAAEAAPVVAAAPAAATPPVVEAAPVVVPATDPVVDAEPALEPEAVVEDLGPFCPEPGFGQGASPTEPVAIADTSETSDTFVPAPGFGHADDLIVAPQADPALTAQDGSMAPRDPVFEAKATAQNAKLAAKPVPMSHPDDATCDAYPTNKAGQILVPASEAAAMESLGFTVAS